MIKRLGPDVIRYKIKMKDISRFGFNEYSLAPKNVSISKKAPTTITENYCYDLILNESNKLKYYDWILTNLKQKGYEISDLKKSKPDDTINFYVFKSKRAQRVYEHKTSGLLGYFQILKEYFIPVSRGAECFKKTKTSPCDKLAKEASLFVYLHEKNKLANAYMEKLLKKLNVKEVDYNPSAKNS